MSHVQASQSSFPKFHGGRSRAWRWLHQNESPDWGASPHGYSSHRVRRAISSLDRWFGASGRFRVDAQGLENIPDEPCLFVSNHSGGSTVLDCLGLGYAWHSHFGGERPLHFLTHEMLLATGLTGPMLHRLGALRADRRVAHEALGEWSRDVAVMPGGDQDTWRPFKDRYQVTFAGHLGYARLAMQAGVPIVPIAHAGPHSTLIVLTDGKRIAKALHLHDLFRIDVFPVHLSFPWGLGVGPWPHVPLPRPLRYRIGKPIYPPTKPRSSDASAKEAVHEFDEQVRAEMQVMLDGLSELSTIARLKERRSRRRAQRRALVAAATGSVVAEPT